MFKKAAAMVILVGFSTFTLLSCASDGYQQNKGAIIGGGREPLRGVPSEG